MKKRRRDSNDWDAEDFESSVDDSEEVRLSTKIEYERFSVSLPTDEAQQLRESAEGGSISQKVRDAIKTRLFCEEVVEEGGELYAVDADENVRRIVLE